jgi:hypothetical protein
VVWIALTTPAVALGVLLLTGPLERWAGSAGTPEQRPAGPARPTAGPTNDPADTSPGVENRS